MSKVGRNELCTCGSQLKYKRCCGRAGGVHPLHALDNELIPQLIRFALDRFPSLKLDSLLHREDHKGPLLVSMMLRWLPVEGKPVLQWFLEEHGSRLPAAARNLLLARQRSLLRVYRVTDVAPGRGLRLADVFNDEETWVHEVSASRQLKPGLWILTGVTQVGEEAILDGMHPQALPADAGIMLQQAVSQAMQKGEVQAGGSVEQSAQWSLGIYFLWESLLEASRHRPPAELRNTDNQQVVVCEDELSFAPQDRYKVVAALTALPDATLQNADPDDVRISILRPGNAMHKTWKNTVTGTLKVRAKSVLVETNSMERADGLLRLIQAAAGEWLGPVRRKTTTPDQLQEQPPEPAEAPPVEVPAELLARITRQSKEEYYQEWLETPLPYLEDLTPRQAAAVPTVRPRLLALLDQALHAESMCPVAERYDVWALRRELGLEGRVPAFS